MTDPKADTLPAPDMRADLARTLAILAGAATSVSVALPAPGDIIARLIAAGLGVAGLMLREGATPQQAVDAIKRVRHLDTSADDAAVDRKIEAKTLTEKLLLQLGPKAPRMELRPVMQAVPVVAEPEPGDEDLVETGELSLFEINAAWALGVLRVVGGGYGFVPRDWLTRLRDRVTKASGPADTLPAPNEPGGGA